MITVNLVFKGSMRKPTDSFWPYQRVRSGSFQTLPIDPFIFDMWDNNPTFDLKVLCGQLMIDNYGIQARL